MNELYYPPKRKKKSRSICTCCSGYGLKSDAKTGLQRQCVACNGVGRIKQKEE